MFNDDRAEMTTDANSHLAIGHGQERLFTNGVLHFGGGRERVVGADESGHHFIAHGLDDRAAELFRGLTHEPNAQPYRFTGALVPELFIQPRAADHVGKEYCQFPL